jgi:hypothetical protein
MTTATVGERVRRRPVSEDAVAIAFVADDQANALEVERILVGVLVGNGDDRHGDGGLVAGGEQTPRALVITTVVNWGVSGCGSR